MFGLIANNILAQNRPIAMKMRLPPLITMMKMTITIDVTDL